MAKPKKKTDDIPTPPFGNDVADLADAAAPVGHRAKPAPESMTIIGRACPTCGNAKTANRCEVCGHQEADT